MAMERLKGAERTQRLMHDICPHRIGSRVKVAPSNQYSAEWPGTYIVVMVAWNYQEYPYHGINIGIASEDDVVGRYGSTDGFTPDDLLPA